MNTRSHAMLDQANRTFICSVVFIDLVGYSKKPVTEQIRLKTSLTSNLSEAIKDIPVNDRIILDTGDGAAISFLGDPEDALVVTLQLREMMQQEGMTATQVEASGDDAVRMGINLGPVKLVKDINGHPNIIGDGINVAQRIMSFARPGQIVVSRSYYDVVSNLASEYAKLFTYEGSRTDKHVREHEIYVVGHSEGALRKARDGMKDRASATSPNPRRAAAAAAGTSTLTLTIPHFAQDRKKLSMIAGGLAMVVLVLLIAVVTKKPSSVDVAAAPSTTSPARPAATEPATRGAEMAKPESRVLEPAPAPSMIPMPAPAETTHEPSAKPDRASRGAASEASRTEPRGEPRNEARTAAAEPRSNAGPPATVVFAVSPWGEIVVNGRSRGVTPPMKSLKLEPGHYKIEVRNTTFPAHTEDLELKARDEVTVRHKFQ